MTTGLYTVAGKKMTIHLHPGQTQAWDSKTRFTFIISGTQSGKTSFEPLWLDREIRNQGEGDYIAATATYDLFKLKFLPEMQHYFCGAFGWEYAAADRVIWKNEGPEHKFRIILRSANSPGGLESATAKAAILDECGMDEFGLDAWEATQRRLSLSRGRVLGGTTPYNLGWLKTQVFDRWRAGDTDYRVIQFKSTMNPAFPVEEYERARRTLPAWKFEMMYNGEFSRPAGMIYEDFTEWHKCDPFPVSRQWPRWLGADFGPVHTAKVFVVQDPATGVYYVVDARIDGNKTSKEHVELIKANRYYQNGMTCFGGSASEKQPRMDWAAAGLPIHGPAITDVEAGIDRVIAMLKQKQLRVFSTCAPLLDEFGTYSRKLDPFGHPTEEIKNKENYHLLDALRYVVIGIGGIDIDWTGADDMTHVEDYQSPWAIGDVESNP